MHAIELPLPSWNDGSAKNAILEFAHATTDPELEIRAADGNDNIWTVPVGVGRLIRKVRFLFPK